ncbi:MAG: hypothetical protein V1726_06510 [Methanobacteriota archaeon]
MRKIVKMGSVEAAVIILLAVFPNIVCAHAISSPKEINSVVLKLKTSTTTGEKIGIIQQLMKGKELSLGWIPGDFIILLIVLLINFIMTYYYGWG